MTMSHDDVEELVWENGRILIRGGRSSSTYKEARLERMDVPNLASVDLLCYREHEKQCEAVGFQDQGMNKQKQFGLSDFPLFLEPAGVESSGRNCLQRIGELKPYTEKIPPVTCTSRPPVAEGLNYEQRQRFEMLKMDNNINDSLPDEQSEAVVPHQDDDAFKNKRQPPNDDQVVADAGKPTHQVTAADASCSLNGSNNPTRCEDSDWMTLPSENSDKEEQIRTRKELRKNKRKRNPQVHSISERKRRGKINEKMRVLQNLLPFSDKVDKASTLDKAIEYLKSLQLQVQLMSMGGFFMPPSMMLPTAMQQIQAPPSFNPMASIGMGIDPRMQMGAFGFNMPAAFPTSTMMGIPGQMLQMPAVLPRAPFIPPFAGSSGPEMITSPATSNAQVGSIPAHVLDAVQRNMNLQMINKANNSS